MTVKGLVQVLASHVAEEVEGLVFDLGGEAWFKLERNVIVCQTNCPKKPIDN